MPCKKATVRRRTIGNQCPPAYTRRDRFIRFWQKLRQYREDLMRLCLLLAALMLAACSDDSMKRNFSLNRDAAPDTLSAARMPLSVPPNIALRPARPGAAEPPPPGQQLDQSAGSEGQDALVDSAGPPATAHIRTLINENSGMIYASPGFVDALMNWTPPPGYTPLTAPPKKSWLSRLL
jgi:hypothetical protein